MKFGDLIALAKAGYKPSEIKELLSMDAESSAGVEKPAETAPKEETQPEPEKTEEKPAEPEAEKPEDINNDMHELQAEIDRLRQQLAKAQKENTMTDMSGSLKDPQEELNEIVRRFM